MSTTLIQDFSLFTHSDKLTEQGTILVRGFASNDLLDREREYVSAASFNLNSFKNTGTILKNHDFLIDDNGNKQAAGKLIKAFAAKISQQNPENESEWIVSDLQSDKVIALWPKDKSPNMLPGDEGVFVVAEITHPQVVKEVINGELGAFSWSGLAQHIKRMNGTVELKNVDLLEISLVNIPANPDATFEVTDENDPTVTMEVSLKDCDIYQFRFDKESSDLDNIKKITKSLNIHTSTISENDESYFVKIEGTELVNPVKCFTYDLGTMKIVAAPKRMNKKKLVLETFNNTENSMPEASESQSVDVTPKVPAEKLYLLDIQGFMKANPNAIVQTQKTIMLGEMPVEIDTIELPAAVQAQEQPVEGEPEVLPPAEEVVVPEAPVVEPAQDTTALQIQQLTEAVSQLATSVGTSLEKVEQIEQAQKSALSEATQDLEAKINSKLQKQKEDEDAFQLANANIQKTLNKLAAFENAVPAQTQREEPSQVVASKSFEQSSDVDAKAYFAAQILRGVK